ncbi:MULTISPECIES: monooxygenase [unclassified Bacillus (in: firmicutes)]|uniref:monooxygenase n=1 Tax=unclassified Bacillus (in: firmicutes) TaxID=185979 RepID=UPI000BF61926|nr:MULTISPECIES: monooxygenase [unclassified Bacillus (in: firmicutes)]PEU15429.1 monooxygenase [Bacillus sp. AFS014408]PFW60757.1 monooxygenase [Bacillus sp. AFS075034]
MKLLQIDFKMKGPWGEEMSKSFKVLAKDIANEKDLIWKIWTENQDAEEAGGIYLFKSEEVLDRYLAKHTARLNSFGITEINAKKFDVNVPLTMIDRGKLK